LGLTAVYLILACATGVKIPHRSPYTERKVNNFKVVLMAALWFVLGILLALNFAVGV